MQNPLARAGAALFRISMLARMLPVRLVSIDQQMTWNRHLLPTLLLAAVAACSTTAKPDVESSLPAIDSQWQWDNPAASEAAFRQLLERAKAFGNKDYTLQVQTQLARSLGMQDKFSEADAVLAEVRRQLDSTTPVAALRCQLEQGRVINSSGHPADAVPIFKRAFDMASAAGAAYYAVDAAHMLGIVSPPAEAIAWNERAIRMVESSRDRHVRGWLGPLYNNLAWTYVDRHEYSKALDLFTRDVAFRTSIGAPFEASIARWSRAKTLRLMGRVSEALAIQMKLLDNPLRKGKPAEGYTQEEIGECLLALGKADESKAHFAEAYRILRKDPWMQSHESDHLARLKRLSM